MARIISIVNQKGGTGKSACTANLAVGLAQKNMKVLIVDADPQSDVSAGFRYRDCDDSNETLTALMDAVMKDEDIPSDCYIRHQAEGIDIICSNIGLAGTEVQLVNAMSREYVLKQILYGIKDQYDAVIIDCMPSLGMITINALAASDEVLIPVEASYLPIKGLQQLLKTIGKVRKQINPKLQVGGILFTMVDAHTNDARNNMELLRNVYGSQIHIFDNYIPFSVRMKEAVREGQSIFSYDPKGKAKVVISLPSGELRETENQIFKLIDDADSRGVDILMKSNDYASLPQHWKNYCRGTENATFPLIIIDDEVAWYGLPTANWKFDVDKTTSLKTVVYMMVRFKGKNTVEMLKALTDIEAVAIGVNTKKLLKKDNNMVTHPMASSSGAVVPDDGKSAYGLAGFVEEKEFCPACKSHMVLTKNARGTAYLKCSNKACKETKYLTVDLMNWYISSHNVGCPKHDGGELKGRLGKYGPYVTCTCGHTLKPHDI